MKRPLRAAFERVVGRYRAAELARLLSRVRRRRTVSDAELRRIRWAWGNPAWTADVGYLRLMAKELQRTSGPVLDIGSGLTTVLAATLRPDVRIVSLEQEGDWVALMRSKCPPNVELVHAPLREYEGYLWYDWAPPAGGHFPLVLVDGPAVFVENETLLAAWRYGVVPELQRHGCTFDIMLLDDVREERGPDVLRRWEALGVYAEILRTSGGWSAIARSSANA